MENINKDDLIQLFLDNKSLFFDKNNNLTVIGLLCFTQFGINLLLCLKEKKIYEKK